MNTSVSYGSEVLYYILGGKILEKSFKTIDEQIDLLKSRNITINDYDKTYKILEQNNYYYLINGYKDLFLDKCYKDRYITNTKIEEIFALYQFDKNIKIHFLEYILLIENKIDTYISYEFSKSYGHKNYLVSENFNNSSSQIPLIKKFIDDVNLEINYQYKNSNKMIEHYINNYGYIPLWVLVRILSFGKISKFFSLMKQKDQNNISRKFNLQVPDFKIYLQNLTLVRNICAHDEKLYDIRTRSRIFSTYYHQELNINKNLKFQYATRDLFSIVIILKVLLNTKDFFRFYINIINDIELLKNNLNIIPIEKVLYKMGFSENYKKLLYL